MILIRITVTDLEDASDTSILNSLSIEDTHSRSDVLLSLVNSLLGCSYTTCLSFAVSKDPYSLFLEHHLWGDDFAAILLSPESIDWALEVRSDKTYRHCGKNQIVQISGAVRFSLRSVFTSSNDGILFVFVSVASFLYTYFAETREPLSMRIPRLLPYPITSRQRDKRSNVARKRSCLCCV